MSNNIYMTEELNKELYLKEIRREINKLHIKELNLRLDAIEEFIHDFKNKINKKKEK